MDKIFKDNFDYDMPWIDDGQGIDEENGLWDSVESDVHLTSFE